MRLSAAFRRCPAALAGVLCVLGLTAAVATTSAVAAGGPCDVTATPETFALALEEATGGQTICLATGDYGISHGPDRALTSPPMEGARRRCSSTSARATQASSST